MPKNTRHTNKLYRAIVLYFLLGGVFVIAVSLLIGLLFHDQFLHAVETMEANGFTYLELLSIQISVTFIVISLCTVFGQRNITVYWQDIIQYKMIMPRFTNFNALSSYVFAALLISIFFILTDNKYVYVSFFISILLIMLLSVKMMLAFFSGDMIRVELENDYRKEKNGRIADPKLRERYRNHKRLLIQYTIQAIKNGDIDIVCTNIGLLYRNDEISDAEFLERTMIADGNIYMLSRVAKTNMSIFSDKANVTRYLEICRQLLDSEDIEVSTYISSIVKSIIECRLDINNESDLPKDIGEMLDSFLKNCSDKNHTELVKRIVDSKKRIEDQKKINNSGKSSGKTKQK
ncbi:MAG: hypothetical protein J5824_05070 [Lachnospiraceae bacterium]|nr:hypothetical protein [Lachnospiraceae bacterium]